MQSEIIGLGIFAIGQTFVAIFWAGIHQERSRAHAETIRELKEKTEAWPALVKAEVKSALEAWQESRGEKISELTLDVEKLGTKIDKGFSEMHDLITAVSAEMSNQHHRIRTIERHVGVQPSEPRLAPVDPRRDR